MEKVHQKARRFSRPESMKLLAKTPVTCSQKVINFIMKVGRSLKV